MKMKIFLILFSLILLTLINNSKRQIQNSDYFEIDGYCLIYLIKWVHGGHYSVEFYQLIKLGTNHGTALLVRI